jgi:hypothetical protein
MKKGLLIWILAFAMAFVFMPATINADNEELEVDWFDIMPRLKPEEVADVNQKIKEIWSEGWKVWENYNKNASWMTTSQQIASWIMTRNTILNYIVFIVKFLSQLWLLVWAWFIMFAWYKYMVSLFTWGKAPSSTLKNAIIWIIIVIFSYAIMRILTSIIWLT